MVDDCLFCVLTAAGISAAGIVSASLPEVAELPAHLVYGAIDAVRHHHNKEDARKEDKKKEIQQRSHIIRIFCL